jgi:hypothetical protein
MMRIEICVVVLELSVLTSYSSYSLFSFAALFRLPPTFPAVNIHGIRMLVLLFKHCKTLAYLP